MSRKKSITISRKPRAQNQSTASEMSNAHVGPPENANSAQVASATILSIQELTGKPKTSRTPASRGFFGKALYGTAYCITYSVVFGSLVIGMLIPGRKLIGEAMTEATDAAKQTFMSLGRRQQSQTRKASSNNRHESSGIADEASLIAGV